jgi:hypothetical protein
MGGKRIERERKSSSQKLDTPSVWTKVKTMPGATTHGDRTTYV